MMINNHVTGLCIHYTILLMVILKCTLSTYKKSLLSNSSLIHLVLIMSLDCIISLVLDLIFVVLYSNMWYRPVAWEQ